MNKNFLFFCSFVVCFGQISCVLNPKVVCYYESWFHWRNGNGKMTVEEIDNKLCTHIVYAYMGVTSGKEVSITDPELMVNQHDLTKLSANKGSAKAMIAIGGWSLSSGLTSMVSTSADRSTFVDSVVSFLQKYDFDGITIDWSRNSWTEDEFSNFVKLLYQLYSKFGGKYTLGITVAAKAVNFDAKKVDPYVDFIMVQTYDFHGSWEKVVGYEAPLDWQFSTLMQWYSSGATMNKLLMTIPLFAHTWILSSSSKSTPGSDATGPGKQGPWSQAEGKLSYNELCTQIKENPSSWELHRDTELASAYGVNGRTWVTFEDPKTVSQKTKNITTAGFGGIVVQALANEDFKGLCGTKYPLLKGINDGLNKDAVHPQTHAPVHTTQPSIVTADPHKLCHKEGTIRDPKDCRVYHKCTEFFPGIFTDEKKECSKGEAFDESDQKCKDSSKVPGCH